MFSRRYGLRPAWLSCGALKDGVISGREVDFVVDFGEREGATDRRELNALSETIKLDEVPMILPLASPVFDVGLVLLDHQVFDQ